jgi:DNA repair exonuclease SbcCD ATPase subunit
MSFNSRIQDATSFLNKKQGQKEYIRKELKEKVRKKVSLEQDQKKHEKALEVVKEVGRKTQEKIQYQISEIATLAMEAVLDTPYKLVVQFVERRNKNECDLLFDDDGQLINPVDATGGGAVDIAAFALRIASWSMQRPRKRNTIILDEPFKYLDKSKHEKASLMLKELSKRLGLQFIIVTHEQKLTEAADRVFEVTKKGKVSQVNQLA